MEEQKSGESMNFFKDDIVQSIKDPSVFGVIEWLGGDHSDSDSSSEEEEEEEEDEENEPEKESQEGLARVSWIDGERVTLNLSEIRVADRRYNLGDVVALASDPLGQYGVVSNLEMFADLAYPNGEMLRNINTRNLRRIRLPVEGDYVIRDHWIGRVEEVVDNVTVIFDDGAKCKVLRTDPERLVPISPLGDFAHNVECCYFPGLRVRAASSSVFKNARWLRGSWKSSRTDGIVYRVDPGSVIVYWLNIGVGSDSPVPLEDQDAKSLIRLTQFSHIGWDIGDHSFMPNNLELDAATEVPRSSQEDDLQESCSSSTQHRKKTRRCPLKKKKTKKEQLHETSLRVIRTKMFADVIWQDGTRSKGIETTSLVSVQFVGDTDFWPEDFVIERGPDAEVEDTVNRRVGIVKMVDAKQKTAKVKWFKRVSSPEEPREFESEEMVSVYEILHHPDYRYVLGDLVIRLTPAPVTPEDFNDVDPQSTTQDTEKSEQPKHNKEPDLSWVGVIVGLEDGDIEVEWTNGVVSKVGPQAIFVIDRDDDEGSEDSTGTEASWETVEDPDDLSMFEGGENPEAERQQQSVDDNNQGGALNFILAIASRLCNAVFGQARGEVSDESTVAEVEEVFRSLRISDEDEQHEHIPQKIAEASPVTESIKRFDIVTDAADHHFFGERNEVVTQRKWLRKVNQEWNILQKDLPETIYVRMYEERMDLMRAVILGADGTPYHDGLFVFDLFLPPDYPSIPPIVHYHSGGLRLNPNLYENGKVCLSLLNTWTGKGSELWNPGTSNILQVLVSIQGLVLNEKPYFNEAGYDRQTGTGEGEKNSVAYNENTFLLNCKTMIYLLRRPPKHLEELIESHFRARALKFLKACEAYLGGVPIGTCSANGDKDQEEGASDGFKLLLRKLMPKLAAAFVEIGATDCKEFLQNSPSPKCVECPGPDCPFECSNDCCHCPGRPGRGCPFLYIGPILAGTP